MIPSECISLCIQLEPALIISLFVCYDYINQTEQETFSRVKELQSKLEPRRFDNTDVNINTIMSLAYAWRIKSLIRFIQLSN